MPLGKRVRCYVGCAGWNIPKEIRSKRKLSHLEQYAQFFNCIEINSSFYRHHQYKTYLRWAETVPEHFRFSVKVPKAITHTTDPFSEALARFLDEVQGLGKKLEVLLLQFPPKRKFREKELDSLLRAIRKSFEGKLVCEARHQDWLEAPAKKLLARFSVSTVIADPKAVSNSPYLTAAKKGTYLRLHGSPRMYFSSYSQQFLSNLKKQKALQSPDTWVMFDNTGLGQAFFNAQALIK